MEAWEGSAVVTKRRNAHLKTAPTSWWTGLLLGILYLIGVL